MQYVQYGLYTNIFKAAVYIPANAEGSYWDCIRVQKILADRGISVGAYRIEQAAS